MKCKSTTSAYSFKCWNSSRETHSTSQKLYYN